jgi:hypothetical protein
MTFETESIAKGIENTTHVVEIYGGNILEN